MDTDDATNSDTNVDAPPPPYEPAAADGQSQRFEPEALPTLVLDGKSIYSRLHQDRLLYEINSPPCEALSPKYSIQKIRHKVSQANGSVKIRTRKDHMYTINSDYVSIGLRGVQIFGNADSNAVFKEAHMSQGIGPSSFKVDGHFQIKRSTKNRLQHGSEICWLDTDGQLIAVETKVERDGEDNVREPPRLEIKAKLDEKVLDLLVACWCARLWKQAEKELTEPVTWGSIKKTVGRYSRRGTIWGGYQ
ncbi:hypothetical protein B0J13DRAFT_602148 [Dactylonectria estremocensis]|uniref:Uncharacterized protein n=1 Tax=Dactylonectria estremocensis TaxID=1079267 RepID=A0A9P9FD30_9HYPO|nr:hypothetical protein B0J13DRAFT_602148 [Dactylonectria estremocensis]